MNKVRLDRCVVVAGDCFYFMRGVRIGDECVTHARHWRYTTRKDAQIWSARVLMSESSALRLTRLLNKSEVEARLCVDNGHVSFIYRFEHVIRYIDNDAWQNLEFVEHADTICLCQDSPSLVECDKCFARRVSDE